MHSFATLTAIAATLASFANAVPLAHGPKHARLHAPRALAMDSEPQIVKLAPLLAERSAPSVQLDTIGGTCGGSTVFGCAEGFCCSRWGYCGRGPLYCGDAPSPNGTAPYPVAGGPTHAASVAAKGPGDGPGRGNPSSWGRPPPVSNTDDDLPSYTPPVSSSANTPPPQTTLAPVPASSDEVLEPAAGEATAPAPSSYNTSPPPASTAPSSSEQAQPSSPSSSGGQGLGDVYTMYSGNGSPSAGWPSEDQWASFEDSWKANVPTIKISCSQFGQEDPSDQEIDDVKSAIESVSSESGVDSRFVLAILMQESKGCVRVPTTTWSHENPGLFQSFKGTGTCNPDGTGVVPCPASSIRQMVSDGVSGTTSGPGLKQNLEQVSATGSQKYYEAARIYNAGSVPSDGNLGAPGATPCYCSDVANRLTGWATADSGCTL